MKPSLVISNSSPLIALSQIEHLNLLEKLFTNVLVPSAVVQEVSADIILPAWIIEHKLTQQVGPRILRASLGPGESEAISLAIEINAELVILDDLPARRLANILELPIIGTLGILLASKRYGFLTAVKPCIDALIDFDFRISYDLYKQVLLDAEEFI
jgi:uncharacterized protein